MRTQTYRTELEIISIILEIIMNVGVKGEYVTTIVRNANLSHNVAIDKIEKLVNAGLVRTLEEEGRKVFIITENGIKFHRELKNFQELMEEIHIGGSKLA